MKILVHAIIFMCLTAHVYPQGNLMLTDRLDLKSRIYFLVCSDQVATGITEFEELRLDSATIQKSDLKLLPTSGLPQHIVFFKFSTVAHGTLSYDYYVCYNIERNFIYRLTMFKDNDLYLFFDDLRSVMGISKIRRAAVQEMDVACMLKAYKKRRNIHYTKLRISKGQEYNCLRYNFQVHLTK